MSSSPEDFSFMDSKATRKRFYVSAAIVGTILFGGVIAYGVYAMFAI